MSDLRISELAAASGVSATTLRFYESEGLLPADRAPNGYRVYGSAAQERLAFISAAKKLQLSLPDIRQLLGVWETESCATVKGELRPAIREQLDRADESIAALGKLRETLTAALARLDQTPDRRSQCDPDCTWLLNTTQQTRPEPASATCSLGGADHAVRIARWHQLLEGVVVTRTGDGAVASLPATRAADIAALIVAEQQCCGFIRFGLDFDGDTVVVTMSSPPEGMVQLEELLPRIGDAGGVAR